tara:strand:- start:3161 stop:3886 length:726 start_codon:yes stop_codon:yes gene_type:complete
MTEFALQVDPYNMWFKKDYKKNSIKILYNSSRLTFGQYYRKYLHDKYRSSVTEYTSNYYNKRKLSLLETKIAQESEFDKMERKVLSETLKLYELKTKKYNNIQYLFKPISEEICTIINKRANKIYQREQERITMLIKFMTNNNIFEYDPSYSVNIVELKNRFKKESKRFIKIEPYIWSNNISNYMKKNLAKEFKMLHDCGIMITKDYHSGDYCCQFVINNNKDWKYELFKNDVINGLRFKT